MVDAEGQDRCLAPDLRLTPRASTHPFPNCPSSPLSSLTQPGQPGQLSWTVGTGSLTLLTSQESPLSCGGDVLYKPKKVSIGRALEIVSASVFKHFG